MAKPQKPHKHKLVSTSDKVLVHRYYPAPNGDYVSSLSALDTIKGFKCETCPYKTAQDLERKIA